MTCDKIK